MVVNLIYMCMNMPMVIGFLNGVLLGAVDYVEFGRSNLVYVNSLLTSSEDDARSETVRGTVW